jgi:hypothetical protein
MGRRAYSEDLIGQTFGRLSVAGVAPYNGHSKRWICVCDCGAVKYIATEKLASGHTKSCGCLRREAIAEFNKSKKTHGQSGTAYYAVWNTMIARCERPRHISYPQYGGRGIRVCQRWRESFEAFAADMGERPDGYEIDRRNNDGNYEPGNCRWVPQKANTRNRRVTPMHEHNGRRMALGDWAETTGIPYRKLKDRIRSGWSVERAINEPIKETA